MPCVLTDASKVRVKSSLEFSQKVTASHQLSCSHFSEATIILFSVLVNTICLT